MALVVLYLPYGPQGALHGQKIKHGNGSYDWEKATLGPASKLKSAGKIKRKESLLGICLEECGIPGYIRKRLYFCTVSKGRESRHSRDSNYIRSFS
jgi:hypothetical protein